MTQLASKSNKLLPEFTRLAIANIISNLMVPLAGIVDTAFLGHLADIHHLAGVALATVIFNVIYWSFGFLRMGTTGMAAQAIGRNDETELWLIALRNSLIGLGFGLLLLLVQWPIRELGFTLLSAPAAVQQAGRAFFDGRIWGAPAVLINYVLLGWFLGRALGTRVIVLSVIGNGANVVLDYLFIVKWGWAATGSGAATAASQYLMLIVGLTWVGYELIRRRLLSQLRSLLPRLGDLAALKALFQLNRDILIRTFALVISFGVFIQLSASLGTQILAANTLLLQVFTLAAYFIDGIAFATESFAGEAHGRDDRVQLRYLLKLAGITSIVLGIAFALVFVLFPRSLLGLMTDHQSVLDQSSQYVLWLLPVLGFGGLAFMLDGYFLGLTAGHALRNSTVFAAVVGFLPTAIAAWHWQQAHLLWLALTLFMIFRAGSLGVLVREVLGEVRR
ncbi:MAG: guanitoxin biosynthesis MATE family efflux transporter GntT [Cyanobacteria bacterium P01_A01_bin.123]